MIELEGIFFLPGGNEKFPLTKNIIVERDKTDRIYRENTRNR